MDWIYLSVIAILFVVIIVLTVIALRLRARLRNYDRQTEVYYRHVKDVFKDW